MKTFKSCLFIFLICCTLIFGGIYFYFLNLNKSCIVDHNKVEQSYSQLNLKLQERNLLLKKLNANDSVNTLITKSDSILKRTKDANHFLWTEFYLNEKTYKNDSLKQFNKELNHLKNIYNSDLKNFHSSWTIFPNNLIKIRQKFPKYNYLTVEYGENNQENMKKRKATEHWVETGEWK